MTTLHRTSIEPYSPAEMYQLVDHIEAYPQFIPWCLSSNILQRSSEEVQATLTMSAGGFHKSFTTCNHLIANQRINITLIDGPFKHLDGAWQFDEVATDKCQVTLDLTFEFSSKLLSFAFAPVFQQATNSLIEAFSKRAISIYGTR